MTLGLFVIHRNLHRAGIIKLECFRKFLNSVENDYSYGPESLLDLSDKISNKFRLV